MSKVQKTVHFEEEFVQMIESTLREAEEADLHSKSITFSDMVRHLCKTGVEHWDGSLRDAVPEEFVEKYEHKYLTKRLQAKDYKNKKASHWRKNWNGELTKFWDDEAASPPNRVRETADKYIVEAQALFDGEELAENIEWIHRKCDEYEEAVGLVSHVEDEGLERVSNDISLGAELARLREQGRELLLDIAQLCESQAYDPDAIIEKIAGDYGVSAEAIEEVLNIIISEEEDTRRVLKGADGSELINVVDREALGENSGLRELPEAEQVSNEIEVDTQTETDGSGESNEREPIKETQVDRDHSEKQTESTSITPENYEPGEEDIEVEDLPQLAVEKAERLIQKDVSNAKLFNEVRKRVADRDMAEAVIEETRKRVEPEEISVDTSHEASDRAATDGGDR